MIFLPSLAIAQPLPPPLGPAVDVGVVPNGDLSSGLAGWDRLGPSMVLGGGPTVEAADNTSVVTPPFTVPVGAQVLPIRLGVPGANAVVQVRARPLDGSAEVVLATIVPDRAVRRWDIGVGGVQGKAIRVVIDPITSLGRRLYVGSVGPIQSVLPGWDVAVGAPLVGSAWGRRGIVADGDAVTLTTPPIRPTPGTAFLGFAVRGDGSVRAAIGPRAARARVTDGAWAAIRVPVTGTAPQRLSVTATPAEGGRMALSDVGVEVRRVRLHAVTVRPAGTGALVRASVGPDAAGMRAEVRAGAKVLGRGAVRADGTVVVRTSRRGTRARLVVLDDARHVGTAVTVVLPR